MPTQYNRPGFLRTQGQGGRPLEADLYERIPHGERKIPGSDARGQFPEDTLPTGPVCTQCKQPGYYAIGKRAFFHHDETDHPFQEDIHP